MRAFLKSSIERPLILMSIWRAVRPSLVPVTLKSMSPAKSSIPWMSVRILYWPVASSETRPMAIPTTGALIGTPAHMSERVEPQTEAIELEPLHLVI